LNEPDGCRLSNLKYTFKDNGDKDKSNDDVSYGDLYNGDVSYDDDDDDVQ
jgi:hypothetical protein